MDKALFEKMFGVSQEYPIIGKLASWMAGGLAKLYSGVYLFALAVVLFRHTNKIIIYLLFPIMTILTSHTFRQAIKRGRPYEEYPIKPFLTSKKKQFGMPSNHSASAMIIAMAILSLDPLWGGVLIFFALVTGICRVLSGIHYPFDVFVGWIIALLYGSLMLYILM